MTLDGCIFGWVLFNDISVPIAHHTGIIVSWSLEDPWKSIVAHYGSDCTSRVLVETLKDAVIRSQVKVVKINPYFKATFSEEPYHIEDGAFILSDELMHFQEEHPEYNILTSNCQHFVQHFVGDIQIESDLFQHVPLICQKIVRTAMFGTQDDIAEVLGRVANSYVDHREQGICAWDPSLDMDVPDFSE